MNKTSRIFIAGHKGLVGSAIYRHLHRQGYKHLLTADRQQLDLLDQAAVAAWFEEEKPEFVFLAAAKVGGIMANNTYRADFLYENLQIQNNIIHSAWKSGVKKLLFLGSTCIYPKEAPQPMSEDALLTGPLEYTNEPYAIAKIAGLKMCESFNIQYGTNFIAVMPTNLYGPNDNFDLEKSHVLPAIIRKIHLSKALMEGNWNAIRRDIDARPIEQVSGSSTVEEITAILNKYGISEKSLILWGTGTPMREFLWSEEMADACVFILEHVDFADLTNNKKEVRNCHINIGSGEEISIRDLAYLVKECVDYRGLIEFECLNPEGP